MLVGRYTLRASLFLCELNLSYQLNSFSQFLVRVLKIRPAFKLEKKSALEYVSVLNSIMTNCFEQKNTIIMETRSDGIHFMCKTSKIQIFFRIIGPPNDKIESICLGLKCFAQLLKYTKSENITFVYDREYLSAFTPDTSFHFRTLPSERITFIQSCHKYSFNLAVETSEFRRALAEVRSVLRKKENQVYQNNLFIKITNNQILFLSVSRDRACYSSAPIKRMEGGII